MRDLPVEVRAQILYNPEMRRPNFFLLGVIGLVLQSLGCSLPRCCWCASASAGRCFRVLFRPM
jgi:hypothetical protein